MALSEIKKKYFDQAIRDHLAEDYFMVGLRKLLDNFFLHCKLMIPP